MNIKTLSFFLLLFMHILLQTIAKQNSFLGVNRVFIGSHVNRCIFTNTPSLLPWTVWIKFNTMEFGINYLIFVLRAPLT